MCPSLLTVGAAAVRVGHEADVRDVAERIHAVLDDRSVRHVVDPTVVRVEDDATGCPSELGEPPLEHVGAPLGFDPGEGEVVDEIVAESLVDAPNMAMATRNHIAIVHTG